MGLTGVKSQQDFKELLRSWIDEGLAKVNTFRDGRWTESLAVGGAAFVKEIRETLGAKDQSVVLSSRMVKSSSFGIFNNLTTPILTSKRPL